MDQDRCNESSQSLFEHTFSPKACIQVGILVLDRAPEDDDTYKYGIQTCSSYIH